MSDAPGGPAAGQVTDSPTPWVAEHVRRYLDSGGQDGHEWRPGVPTLLLTTTGRRSGLRRRTALIYGRDAGDYVVVASKGGAPEHPAWFTNLAADPKVEVQVAESTFPAVARVASGPERARLWEAMAEIWPDYRSYATRTDREIPVVVLTPQG
jgi:deazaflavin-dependent oxidoreductase (nitroreductase family)